MNKYFSILISFFAFADLHAQQDTSFQLIRELKGDILNFTVDNLDNVYVLNSRGQVKKFDSKGDSVAVFNDIRKYGQATLIDVSNPLKILLYYRDFATVVMLDRFLNAVNTIDLRKQNVLQARVIGQSYDNMIWVFDEVENKLKKIDENGKLKLETPDFRLLLGLAPVPIRIFDESRYVYVYDSTYGVYVFDYYGSLKNNIMILHWQNFKVADKFIFGSRADSLFRYDIRSFRVDEWKMPKAIQACKFFNFSSTRLYGLIREKDPMLNRILIYSIK